MEDKPNRKLDIQVAKENILCCLTLSGSEFHKVGPAIEKYILHGSYLCIALLKQTIIMI